MLKEGALSRIMQASGKGRPEGGRAEPCKGRPATWTGSNRLRRLANESIGIDTTNAEVCHRVGWFEGGQSRYLAGTTRNLKRTAPVPHHSPSPQPS